MIELTFLKVLMLIRQVNKESVLFFTIGFFQIKDLSFKGEVINLMQNINLIEKSRKS